jgi:hypothetical protein
MHESGVLYNTGTAKFRNQLATNYQNARERLPDSRFLIDQGLINRSIIGIPRRPIVSLCETIGLTRNDTSPSCHSERDAKQRERNPFFAASVNHRNCNNHLLIKVSTGDDHPIPSKFPRIIFGYE